MQKSPNLTRTTPTRVLDVKMFDRRIKGMHRARTRTDLPYDLHKVLAQQMIERRAFVKRDTPVVLEVGAHTGWFLRHMLEQKRMFGCRQYIQCDSSEERLNRNYNEVKHMIPRDLEFVQICCDEEQPNAFELPNRSVDMAISNLSLHWINHLEPAMVNIRRVLKRDAFLLGTIFGANTLFELRSSFAMADMECDGGASPHVSPMLDGAGVSELMMQAGYTLPNVDMDRFVVTYPSPFHLMEHLQEMGESACHIQRRKYVPRETLLAMAAIYERLYAKDGLCPATFEVFHTMAWSPSPDQPQPLERGSATMSMTSVGSGTQKEFQDALAAAAKDPHDLDAQKRCEILFKEMQDMMTEQRKARGEDVENTEPSAKLERERPLPPGVEPEPEPEEAAEEEDKDGAR